MLMIKSLCLQMAVNISKSLCIPRQCLILWLTVILSLQVVYAKDNPKMFSNHLINSHDPYLLLHAHNPVHWYPWGEEALQKSRRENKPIFLSIGYSTCYWCHVAEREIYSNPEIAKLMNQWFVNIKVDREQRPDLDRIYMLASQIMTGHGGWPNNLFLTPELKPFFAGSYFPPEDSPGQSGFPKILTQLHQVWINDPKRVVSTSEQIYQALQKQPEQSRNNRINLLSTEKKWFNQAVKGSVADFDQSQGGFGSSTKFPKAPQLSMLLALSSRNSDPKILAMVTHTLQAMAVGGIMDQLAGGFHRYSTEPSWSIPHFEKMLYDNAQLLSLYAQAYQLTRQPFFKQVTERTAHYLITAMQAPGGCFYSAEDAEVDGVEGASYVWTQAQIESTLGSADSQRFFDLYQLVPQQESSTDVLRLKVDVAGKLIKDKHLAATINTMSAMRNKLLAVRQLRPQAVRDQKIVTADNALVISGLVEAGQVLDDKTLIETAVHTAERLWQQAFDSQSGELKHQIFQGQVAGRGFLDDYALLGQSFIALYHVTQNKQWLSRAKQIAEAMLQHFVQVDGTLASSLDQANLLIPPPAEGDSVKPSGQSAAIGLLLELADNISKKHYADDARRFLLPLVPQINAYPDNWGALLRPLSKPKLLAALNGAKNVETQPVADKSPDSADHVHASGYWKTVKGVSELVVKVNIDKGYHINANPASDPQLIATQLLLTKQPVMNVNYPPSQTFKAPFAPSGIAVYQGQITLTVPLPHPQEQELPVVSLRVQACNDKVCLAPAIITVHISLSEN